MTHLEADRGADIGAQLEEHRRAVVVHCYRFLGSLHDAEEATQEAFLKAWRNWSGFEGKSSVKTWLYKIATRVCLDMIDKRKRRITPVAVGPAADPGTPPAGGANDISWLEPLPGGYLTDETLDPAAAYSSTESVKLAFIAALQTLPARQRAVLILRDVLAWSAAETASALDMSLGAANSALHRARQTVAEHAGDRDPVAQQDPDDPKVIRLLEAYLRAWQRDDIDGLVATLQADVRLAMPPSVSWYSGRDDVVRFLGAFVLPQGAYSLVATTANGQPAFETLVRGPDGVDRPVGMQVLTVDADGVSAIDFFLDPAMQGAAPPEEG